MRRVVVLAVLLVAAPLHADDAGDGTLPPRTAAARLVGRSVQIEAHFEFDVDGPNPRGTTQQIALPHRAVITGATAQTGGHTQRLRLDTVTATEKRFEAIYGRPGKGAARAWAIRIDASSDVATIEVAAPTAARVTLAMTIEVPACFVGDTRAITMPPSWRGVITGGNPVSDAAPVDTACGTFGDNDWIAFAATELARRPGGEQRIGVQASRLPLALQDLTRVEITLAKQLTEIPADLHTVLVVDHSRSMTPAELDTQRAVIASYLSAAPHGRVQVVAYARDARALLPGWMPAERAASRIDRELRALPPRNGSNVGNGIATAAALLAHAPGTRRMIVFTDERVARRTLDDLADYPSSLPADTLVHVVAVQASSDRVQRADDGLLASLAQATEGMSVIAGVDDQGHVDALPLARPTSFDHLKISTGDWELMDGGDLPCVEDNDDFREGLSCSWLAKGSSVAGELVVEGFLWGRKVTRSVKPDRRDARALARLLSTLTDLPDELLTEIERAAVAVNRTWALVAIWGASGGYGDLDGWGTIGIGSMSTSSHDSIGVRTGTATGSRSFDELLHAQLAAAVRACKPRGRVSASIELTNEEIVGVVLDIRDASDITLDTCIADGIWDTALVIPDPPHHLTVRVEFPPG